MIDYTKRDEINKRYWGEWYSTAKCWFNLLGFMSSNEWLPEHFSECYGFKGDIDILDMGDHQLWAPKGMKDEIEKMIERK